MTGKPALVDTKVLWYAFDNLKNGMIIDLAKIVCIPRSGRERYTPPSGLKQRTGFS